MEFLVQLEIKEKQACWGPSQDQEGTRVLQVSRETEELLAGPVSPAGRVPWEMLGLKDLWA